MKQLLFLVLSFVCINGCKQKYSTDSISVDPHLRVIQPDKLDSAANPKDLYYVYVRDSAGITILDYVPFLDSTGKPRDIIITGVDSINVQESDLYYNGRKLPVKK